MARLRENARTFESVCLSTRGERTSCAGLCNDISSSAEAIGRGLEEAEDAARRSWVPPGVIRDLRRKHGLEEPTWADIAGTVRRLTNQYQGRQ
jgi:hypothetical protein